MPHSSIGAWWLLKDLAAPQRAVKSIRLRLEKFTLRLPWFSKMRELRIEVGQFEGDETAWVECRKQVRCIGTRAECIAVIRAHCYDWLAEAAER